MIHHKITTICVLWEFQNEKKKKESESFFKEIIAKIFTNLERNMNIQIHEAQKFSPSKNKNKRKSD